MGEFQPTNKLHRKHFWFLIPLRYCWVRLFCFEFIWLLCIMMREVARTLKNLNNNNENNNSRDYWSSLTSSSCCSHHSTVLLWKRAKSSNIRHKAAWLPRWKYFRAASLPFFIGWTLGLRTSDNNNNINNNNNNSNWTCNLVLGVRTGRGQKIGSDMI